MTPAADREMAEKLLSELAIGLSADHEYFTVNLNENIAAVLSLITQVRADAYEDAAQQMTRNMTVSGHWTPLIERFRKKAVAARELAKSESKAGR